MREYDRLNARFVATVTKEGYHADGRGLYLVVDRQGKRWSFLFQWRGKRREMGLGPLHDVSLKEAREQRDAARRLVRNGVDPVAERKRVGGQTFGEIAEEYIAAQAEGKSPKTTRSWTDTLKNHAGAIWNRPAADIETEDVLAVLRPIWTKTPEVAGKLRGRIETVLDAAKAKGLRSGENPARWKGHLSHSLSPRQKLTRGHFAALPYAEAPKFWKALAGRSGVGAEALRLTILTCLRSTEARGARGEEFDTAAKVWTVPPERMKKIPGQPRKEHRVPLSTTAAAIVGDNPPAGLLFPGVIRQDKPISDATMMQVLERMGFGAYTVHGFRSTFRDWAAETTDFHPDIVEMCLAHKVGSQVERAYRRGDALAKRREVMEAWAIYLADV